MRPLGVSIIAALTWFMGALWALAGFSVIGFSHLGARLLSTLAEDNMLQRLTSGVGTFFGIGILLLAVFYIIVGFGTWNLKNWARILTIVFVGLGLLLGLRSLIEYHHIFRIFRTTIDAVILIYLFIPDIKSRFA